MNLNSFCLSSYLTFRYVVKEGIPWKEGVLPKFPQEFMAQQVKVRTSEQILDSIREQMRQATRNGRVAILLSGGIDSAILAAMMPPHSQAYTIRFQAPGALDESIRAMTYANLNHLQHIVVNVTWQDYLDLMDDLMIAKNSPLHPVEVGLFKAARTAKDQGIETLILGNGADSTFGGLDQLLSRDWSLPDFIKRYTFVEPSLALRNPISMAPFFEQYQNNGTVDVVKFLKIIHGLGIIQAFDNAISLAGCTTFEPYENLVLDERLDFSKIRQGESKYLLRTIFTQLYPDLEIPSKVAFARPMDKWLENWHGPRRPEFRADIDLNQFSGEQKWLLYCLDRFLHLVDG